MNLEEKIKRSRINLLLKHPFYACILLRRPFKEDTGTKAIAWTDGDTIGYNPERIESFTVQELSFLWAHEAAHIARKHHLRRGKRNPKIWNAAADYQINLNLRQDGLTMPPVGLIEPAYAGMSTEQIYEILKQSQSEQCSPDEVRDWPGDRSPGEIEAESRKLDAEIITAHSIANKRGHAPAGYDVLINEIKNPCVDWRYLLRQYIQASAKDDYTWRRPNKRYAWSGLYMPSMHSERIGELAVAIDTSGSTLRHQSQFLAEVKAIAEELKPSKLHLLWCDTEVYPESYDNPSDISNVEPRGGGGTSFVPPFKWLEEQGITPVCMVYLTDLYGDFPDDPGYPVIWVDCANTETPPFGDHIPLRD